MRRLPHHALQNKRQEEGLFLTVGRLGLDRKGVNSNRRFVRRGKIRRRRRVVTWLNAIAQLLDREDRWIALPLRY